MLELVYLIAAKRRFKGFLHMMQRFSDGSCRLVPTTDILLMLMTHQVAAFSVSLELFYFLLFVIHVRCVNDLLAINEGFTHAISKV